jgi:hypothetical protein
MSSLFPGAFTPSLQGSFFNSNEDQFRVMMESIHEARFNMLNSSNDNSFRAVCLSGLKTSSNSGTGRNRFDGYLDNNSRINITVMPTTKIDQGIYGFDNVKTQEELLSLLDLYSAVFKAKSDFKSKMTNAPQFGQILDCYLVGGSLSSSDFTNIMFSAPREREIDDKIVALAGIEGVESIPRIFDNGMVGVMGGYLNIDSDDITLGSNQTEAQALFEARLGAALRERGLKFKVTDRSRTAQQQVDRIKNKYYNNGPAEVIATYGSTRGPLLNKYIEENNEQQLLQLASKTSRHLTGAAIDIRSRWYSDSEITTVLEIIRQLGGNPLLENIRGCWESSGRNVTITKRVAGATPGGTGKNTPCHNEHIHIDIPEDYS